MNSGKVNIVMLNENGDIIFFKKKTANLYSEMKLLDFGSN
jgi:hypothetical protein